MKSTPDIGLFVYEFAPRGFTGNDDTQDWKILWIAAVDLATAKAVAPKDYNYWDNADGVRWTDPSVDILVMRRLPT